MEYEIRPVNRFSLNFKEIWEYKELFYFFTWRDVKVKYKQTVLGFVWAVLQPTLMMFVFTFLFGKVIGAQENIKLPYPVFVYTGLLLWGIFSGGVQAAGSSMVNNSNIIKKVYFPRLIIPLSAVLVSVFDFLMTMVPFIVMIIIYQVHVDWLRLIFFFPLSVLIVLSTTFGMGAFLAAVNVKYRDFRYVLPFIVQFLMFATPVIYPVNLIQDKTIQTLLSLNPLSGAINIFRAVFEDGIVDYQLLGLNLLLSLGFLIFGIFYFRKTEAYFADLA
jgi:lipopolysaccharide transport system permease protein